MVESYSKKKSILKAARETTCHIQSVLNKIAGIYFWKHAARRQGHALLRVILKKKKRLIGLEKTFHMKQPQEASGKPGISGEMLVIQERENEDSAFQDSLSYINTSH